MEREEGTAAISQERLDAETGRLAAIMLHGCNAARGI